MRKQQRERIVILVMGIILGLAVYNFITALTPILGWILLFIDFGIFCIYEESIKKN